ARRRRWQEGPSTSPRPTAKDRRRAAPPARSPPTSTGGPASAAARRETARRAARAAPPRRREDAARHGPRRRRRGGRAGCQRAADLAPAFRPQRRYAVIVARNGLEVARHERGEVQLAEAAALDEGDADLDAGARQRERLVAHAPPAPRLVRGGIDRGKKENVHEQVTGGRGRGTGNHPVPVPCALSPLEGYRPERVAV